MSRPVTAHISSRTAISGRTVIGGGLCLAVVAGLVLLWHATPLARLASPEVIVAHLETIRSAPWAIPVLLLAFMGSGLFFFPVTAIIAATAIVFGPLYGFGLSVIGALAGAAAGYSVGGVLGRFLPGDHNNRGRGRLRRITERIQAGSMIEVALIRMIPIAPFSLVNMAFGISGTPFMIYLAGTLFGLLPGMAVMVFMGDALSGLLRDPAPARLLYLGAGLTAWLLLLWGSHRVVHRIQARQKQKGGRA